MVIEIGSNGFLEKDGRYKMVIMTGDKRGE